MTILVISGCAGPSKVHELMPAPARISPHAEAALLGEVPLDRRRDVVDLLYITDRAPVVDPHARYASGYGERRSSALSFGKAQVALLPSTDWETLRAQSLENPRKQQMTLGLAGVTELGSYPPGPYRIRRTPRGMVRDTQVLDQHREANAALKAEVERRLQSAPSGRVILYVHGFNETFATAAYTAAELCHFLGRRDVCSFFTWPASSRGNALFAYARTTESAQYAVGHLKRTIRVLARTPGVEGVQLLAHSRGAAVMLNAVRELSIEAVASGADPAETFKLEQIVLMSPDIDAQVASQQLEVFASDPDLLNNWRSDTLPRFLNGRLTVYASPEDRALKLAQFLFGSRERVGQLTPDEISPQMQDYLASIGVIDLILYEGKRTDAFGHSYFLSKPEVSADLIELVRNGTLPGTPSRPLVKRGPVVWAFPPAGTGSP
ncbi:MAG: alpha/beta hydrolase [Chromatiaceae bacterium]|nr:alpha/beta hydrolase [Chromatiaceae bacterium]